MTAAAAHSILPHSYAERLALADEIRVPATLEEYLAFAESCEYRVEYSNGQIISMGQPAAASFPIVFKTVPGTQNPA